MTHTPKAFSILEVLTVIAILAVVSAFVVPNFISWRNHAKLRGAVNNLKGDFEMAKARAIRENGWVAIVFNNNQKRYAIFLDNGAGGAVERDWYCNGTERLLRNREIPGGVTIDIGNTRFGALGAKTRFNGRGHCIPGSAVLRNNTGESMKVKVSRLGQFTIEKGS